MSGWQKTLGAIVVALAWAACAVEVELDAPELAGDGPGWFEVGAEHHAVAGAEPGDPGVMYAGGTPLRYLSINVGNSNPWYFCWEYKLCKSAVVSRIRSYIAAWQPDVILLTEVYDESQLYAWSGGSGLLPAGYQGMCGGSEYRSGASASPWAYDSSHEHDCIAWKQARVSYAGGALSARGRDDGYGQWYCDYHFTGLRVNLTIDGRDLQAVVAHPQNDDAACRVEEIGRYWSELATGDAVIIGGDWNTESASELQVPAGFQTNYSNGNHFGTVHGGEWTADYGWGWITKNLDHTFSNFGAKCTDCGGAYGTASLPYGSVVGGTHGHASADGGEGMDHYQILVDLVF